MGTKRLRLLILSYTVEQLLTAINEGCTGNEKKQRPSDVRCGVSQCGSVS